jgi:hypothetical protein
MCNKDREHLKQRTLGIPRSPPEAERSFPTPPPGPPPFSHHHPQTPKFTEHWLDRQVHEVLSSMRRREVAVDSFVLTGLIEEAAKAEQFEHMEDFMAQIKKANQVGRSPSVPQNSHVCKEGGREHSASTHLCAPHTVFTPSLTAFTVFTLYSHQVSLYSLFSHCIHTKSHCIHWFHTVFTPSLTVFTGFTLCSHLVSLFSHCALGMCGRALLLYTSASPQCKPSEPPFCKSSEPPFCKTSEPPF